MTTLILLTVFIIFLGTLTHATIGFGLALVSMPLLVLTVGVQTAAPLVAFMALTVEGIILWHSWREVNLRALWRLIAASMIGIPFGLYVLTFAPETVVKAILGLVLITFSLYSLTQPRLVRLYEQKWAYIFGFIAGVLGGAYNTSGPPVVLYGTLNRWPPPFFRANIQSYFFPVTLFIFLGHGMAGLWTLQVLQLYGVALPLVLAAIFLGDKLNRRIPTVHFEKLIFISLIVLGFMLLI